MNENKPMKPMFFDPMWDLAHTAGMTSVAKLNVVPMIVSENSERCQREWFVPDGVCGFAWVVVRPANCAFAKWMKANKNCHTAYGGGMQYRISAFNQSMQRKEAYAVAFAGVLYQFGINAHAGSRMD